MRKSTSAKAADHDRHGLNVVQTNWYNYSRTGVLPLELMALTAGRAFL